MQLDGKSDECPQQAPSQFLVIRNLPSSVNESTLATGMKKLYVTKVEEPKQPAGAPAKLKSTAPVGNTSGLGAKPGSLTRVFMIRDRYSDTSCRYGCAEFSNIEDARAAVAKYNATPQFTISSKPVTVAYIHSGVFIPYFKAVTDHDRKFTFSATHNPSLRLSYWNPSVYASEFTVFDEGLYEEKPSERTEASSSAAKDSKKRKAEKDLTAPGGKKTIAMAPQLAKWANKHAELHGASKKGANKNGTPDAKLAPAMGVNSLGAFAEPAAAPSVPSKIIISYADLDQMCCLLCRRKFVSEPSLRRHEQLSDLHKKNVDDPKLIEKATADLKALGKEPTSNYRDRARERREAHNQPVKPKPNLPRKQNQAPKVAEPKDSTPSKPAVSKGAGLLAKMGWSAGAGLGAEGSGRTSIIETMAYTPGVGLGAEGGKLGDAVEEAARATKNDYKDFVAKAKDKARERYEKMG
jgi:RNA-binding protein 5/10